MDPNLKILIEKLVQQLGVPQQKEPRDILVQWTLELMKLVERESLHGSQKLLVVQSTLLGLLEKESAIFESASLQKMFVMEEVPVIVSTAIALTKDPLFQKLSGCWWICK